MWCCYLGVRLVGWYLHSPQSTQSNICPRVVDLVWSQDQQSFPVRWGETSRLIFTVSEDWRGGRRRAMVDIHFFPSYFSVYSAWNQRCNLCGRRRQNLSLNLVTSTRGSPTTVSNHKAQYSDTIGPLDTVVSHPGPWLVNEVPGHKNSLSKHNILQRELDWTMGKIGPTRENQNLCGTWCDSTLRLGTRGFYRQ